MIFLGYFSLEPLLAWVGIDNNIRLTDKGYSTIQQFILYYLQDVVQKPYVVNFFGLTSFVVPNDKSAAALYMLFMLTR